MVFASTQSSIPRPWSRLAAASAPGFDIAVICVSSGLVAFFESSFTSLEDRVIADVSLTIWAMYVGSLPFLIRANRTEPSFSQACIRLSLVITFDIILKSSNIHLMMGVTVLIPYHHSVHGLNTINHRLDGLCYVPAIVKHRQCGLLLAAILIGIYRDSLFGKCMPGAEKMNTEIVEIRGPMAEEVSERAESKGLTVQEYVLFVLVNHLEKESEEEQSEEDESSDEEEENEDD